MDVRAKQLLSYHVAWFLSACVWLVSPHVISTVRCFLVFPNGRKNKTNFLKLFNGDLTYEKHLAIHHYYICVFFIHYRLQESIAKLGGYANANT